MRTSFSPEQRNDPDIASSEAILRRCVHCGFCTATCPTYVLLGDERDSPRGRITMIKSMLEQDRPPHPSEITHIDRCMSCLSCVTTCPSGVDYMHLVDHARAVIEQRGHRKWSDRILRYFISTTLTNPALTRIALIASRPLAPLSNLMRRGPMSLRRIAAMLDLAQSQSQHPSPAIPHITPARSKSSQNTKGRVILLAGCVQNILGTATHAATLRLLQYAGYRVTSIPQARCCGALPHHLGHADAAHHRAQTTIQAWRPEFDGPDPAIAILTHTSGCATTLKDYGFIFRNNPKLADDAKLIAQHVQEIGEFLSANETLQPDPNTISHDAIAKLKIGLHIPCSLYHGQRLRDHPQTLLEAAGFHVRLLAEPHLCCGSAGVYNILQPDIARNLATRKARHIKDANVDLVATANLGCQNQLASISPTPLVHYVELLDWACGGPPPSALPSTITNPAPA